MLPAMRPCLLAILAALALGGCASTPDEPAEFVIEPGGYGAAFAAAKEALIDARFELDRVDALAGVITTHPKPTSGFATPWDGEQSDLSQEWEDLINRQLRRVRVTFDSDAPPSADRREAAGPMTGRVEVTIDRLRRPGWRIESSSIRFSSFAYDPDLAGRQMWPNYKVAYSQDSELARRLASDVRSRIGPGATP